MAFTIENVAQIWNDDRGTRIEVGPDRDSLDMLEIRQHNSDGKVIAAIIISKEEFAILYGVMGKIVVGQ